MSMERWWKVTDKGNGSTGRKTCPIAAFLFPSADLKENVRTCIICVMPLPLCTVATAIKPMYRFFFRVWFATVSWVKNLHFGFCWSQRNVDTAMKNQHVSPLVSFEVCCKVFIKKSHPRCMYMELYFRLEYSTFWPILYLLPYILVWLCQVCRYFDSVIRTLQILKKIVLVKQYYCMCFRVSVRWNNMKTEVLDLL
jgi:hypothetical protein